MLAWIVDQVRRAVQPDGAAWSEPDHWLGTAIMLSDNPLLADLWRGEIDWVCLGDVALRKLLAPLLQTDPSARKSPASPAVRDLLVRLGGTLVR